MDLELNNLPYTIKPKQPTNIYTVFEISLHNLIDIVSTQNAEKHPQYYLKP